MMTKLAGHSVFLVLFVTVFLDFLGFAMVLSYLHFYAESRGATMRVYGLLLTSYSVTQLAFTSIWGALSDRLGRRKIMLLCIAGSGASFVVFGLANNTGLLFLARIATGAMSGTVLMAMAYAADISAPEKKMAQMGKLGAAFGMGLILGPPIGGTLSSSFGYAVPVFLAAALAFSNLALGYFRMPESWGEWRLEFRVSKSLTLSGSLRVGGEVEALDTFAGVDTQVNGLYRGGKTLLSAEARWGQEVATQQDFKVYMIKIGARAQCTGLLVGNVVKLEKGCKVQDVYDRQVIAHKEARMNSVFAEEVEFGDNCAAEKIAHTRAAYRWRKARCPREPAGKSRKPPYLSAVSCDARWPERTSETRWKSMSTHLRSSGLAQTR